jgi:hypothetical protein
VTPESDRRGTSRRSQQSRHNQTPADTNYTLYTLNFRRMEVGRWSYSQSTPVVASISPCAKCMYSVSPWYSKICWLVLTGRIRHGSRERITRFADGSDIAEDSVLGDNDYAGWGPESTDAVLRSAVPEEHSV